MPSTTRSVQLRRTVLITTTLLALGGVAACGSEDPAGGDVSAAPEAASTDDVLTVYSGRTENLIQPLLDSFAEQTGATVDVRYFDSADLALLVEQEGERSPADVFISQSPGALGYLNDLGLLTELEPEVLDLVSDDFQATDGRWVGMSGRVRTLVYNSELVEPSELPTSVFDLTDPAWSGRIGVPPTNGSFQDFVTALRETEGDDAALEWLEGIVANEPVTYSNNTATLQAVAAGEVEVGLVNHYYNYRALAEDPSLPTLNHFFEAGDIGNLNIVTGVAVVETTDDAELANDFVEFMLGEEAQTFFSEETFEYPLVEGIAPGADLPPIADLGIATFDVNSLGGGLARTQELIAESGLEG